MSGPWEKYARASTSTPAAVPEPDGPWARYRTASAGNTQLAGVPGYDAVGRPQVARAPAVNDDGILDRIVGVGETALTTATGMVGGLVGSVAGVGKTLTGGNYGTQAGIREGDQFAGRVAEALTYQPRTKTGGAIVSKIGSVIADSGIVGLPIPELNNLARSIGSAASTTRHLATVSAAAQNARDAALVRGPVTPLRDLVRRPQPLSGAGAAATTAPTLRQQRAGALPVPIKLTRGQASRDFDAQRFERETAKLPEGAPLRERFSDQNRQVVQNIDAFIDETGALAPDLRTLGQVVVDAAGGRKAMKKAEVRQAYAAAREAGHMADEIDVTPLVDYIGQNRSKIRLAPILSTIESEIKKNGKTVGGDLDSLMMPRPKRTVMDLNTAEDLRQAINKLSEPGTPNVVYGLEAKKLIDAAAEGKGGPLYQQARRQYENYANEFKNRGVIDKLFSTKPGTKDRHVAFEDVLDHAVFKGPLDDVRHMRRTLQTAGPQGEQAWRELQGGTLNRIKRTILSNTARDQNGNSIVSPAKLDRLVENLDADGKLDFIFGKQGAEKIRDLNDLAKDVYTSPPGSVNPTSTASVLISALDLSSSAFTGLPMPAATALNLGIKKLKSNRLKTQVREALGEPKPTRRILSLRELPRRQP